MSHIDDLIAEMCPQGVPHRALKEVAAYSNTRIDSVKLDATNFVGVDNLLANKAGRTDATYLPNTERLSEFRADDILLGNIRPYLKKVWLADRTGGCSGDVLAIRLLEEWRSFIVPKFLYFLLSSDNFFAYNMQHAKGAKMPRGGKQAILDFRVPVPPLEVQWEIVRILDEFTQLEAELEAELEARRRQYEHFLHEFLRFGTDSTLKNLGITPGNGMDYAPLGELVRIRNGKDYKHLGQGDVPVYGTGGIMRYVDRAAHQGPSVLIPRKGSLDKLYYVNEPFWTVDTIFYTEIGDRLIPKFLYYYLATQHLEELNQAGGIPSLTQSVLNQLRIPVPPLATQAEVVRVLDKFAQLMVDIEAELAARRQQYEYYRDRLLTFQEAAA